eukprot:179286-Chlamydomonas_euryale.AAC.4
MTAPPNARALPPRGRDVQRQSQRTADANALDAQKQGQCRLDHRRRGWRCGCRQIRAYGDGHPGDHDAPPDTSPLEHRRQNVLNTSCNWSRLDDVPRANGEAATHRTSRSAPSPTPPPQQTCASRRMSSGMACSRRQARGGGRVSDGATGGSYVAAERRYRGILPWQQHAACVT